MKNFVEKLFGIDKIREQKELALKEAEEARLAAEQAEAAAQKAKEAEELANLSPKQRATRKKEPWVSVLQTHVAKDNLRNGFFELDWNEYFILQLREAGYGAEGDPDEEVVDRWFRQLCRDVAGNEGIDMSRRGAGYINVNDLGNGRTERG